MYKIVRCTKCGLFKTNVNEPYLKLIKRYYSKGYFTGSSSRTAYPDYEGDHEVDAKNFQHYLDEILKFKDRGRLLDIGCATGGLMRVAEKNSFEVFGNDASVFAVGQAKKRFGGRVKNGDFARLRYRKDFFDVVTMFDVVEHLQNPKASLSKIHRILKPKGLLALTTGDSRSLTSRLMGKHWFFFLPPQHLWVFDRNNLQDLLMRERFKVLKVKYVGRSMSLRHLFHLQRTAYPNIVSKYLYHVFSSSTLSKREIYLNFFSTMLILAQKQP